MSSTDEIRIRPWSAADTAKITEIYRHHVRTGTSSWELDPPDEAEVLRRAESLVGSGYPYLVAHLAGDVVGYAYAGAYRPRPAYRHTVENSVYVADGVRRHGIGKALMRELIEICTSKGYRQMIAVIGDAENLQSISFHEALGFENVGTVKNIGFKFNRWMDQILLQRTLGDGANVPPGDISQ